MYPTEFSVRHARDHLKRAHEEARVARLRPSPRARVSAALYALAERLEPGVGGRYAVGLQEKGI